MSIVDINEAEEQYGLLMVQPRQNLALMRRRGSMLEVPSVTIPRYTRPAEQLTTSVLQKWALDSVVIEWLPKQPGQLRYALLEIASLSQLSCSSDLCPIGIDEVSEENVPLELLNSTRRMLAGEVSGRGPFSRFGWLEDAKRWIAESVHDETVAFSDVRQLNANDCFALVRFGTTGGRAYWLKAVGPPNTHEFATTSYLAKHCAQYLPRIVAFRPEWNAWLMEEFGSSLHSSNSLADFEHAVVKLAQLQKQLAGKTDDLLAAQFVDHRIHVLASHVDELVSYLTHAMRNKPAGMNPPITPERLSEIGRLLHVACRQMEELEIPDSVMHSDISPGSILGNGDDCVFTDWCEAYVGNPFITLEQLCVHVARKTDDSLNWARRLRLIYKSCWIDALREAQIDRALQLVPLISVLSYLYNRGDWLQSPRRYEPEFESYSRSLAHYMDRISSSPEFLEAIWQWN